MIGSVNCITFFQSTASSNVQLRAVEWVVFNKHAWPYQHFISIYVRMNHFERHLSQEWYIPTSITFPFSMLECTIVKGIWWFLQELYIPKEQSSWVFLMKRQNDKCNIRNFWWFLFGVSYEVLTLIHSLHFYKWLQIFN